MTLPLAEGKGSPISSSSSSSLPIAPVLQAHHVQALGEAWQCCLGSVPSFWDVWAVAVILGRPGALFFYPGVLGMSFCWKVEQSKPPLGYGETGLG